MTRKRRYKPLLLSNPTFEQILVRNGVGIRKCYRRVFEKWPDFDLPPTGDPLVDELDYQNAMLAALGREQAKQETEFHNPRGRPLGARNKSKRPLVRVVSAAALRKRKQRSKPPPA